MADFPPKVPCAPGVCAYGEVCGPTLSDPYGCGACCGCYGCRAEIELEQAYIPETPTEHSNRLLWEQWVENQ